MQKPALALLLLSLGFVACAEDPRQPVVHPGAAPTVTRHPKGTLAEQVAVVAAKSQPRTLGMDAASHALDVASASAELAAEPTPVACQLNETSRAAGLYLNDARSPGRVALTFDDGPHPGKTPRVLDLLQQHGLHATFFVVGAAIRPTTYHLLQRMVAEGHVIGSHSYNHDIKMATRRPGRGSIDYVRGQHEVTRILIDLALMAQSADDFTRLYRRIFEQKEVVYLPASALRRWPTYFERHRALLEEAGYVEGTRPYAVLYSRPPGGAPYLEPSEPWQREVYDAALAEAGLVNVMWHDESGDTNPEKRHDFAFLTANLQRGFKRGGVVLVHDYIRSDALSTALSAAFAPVAQTRPQIVPLAELAQDKFGCDETTLRASLYPRGEPQTRVATAATSAVR